MAHFKPFGYAGTPNFPKIILEKGAEFGADLSSVKKVLVGGGAPLLPLRQAYEARGISVLQSCGTADVGNIAYETEGREGVVLDEGVNIEIVRPSAGDLVADGEVGEVVMAILNEDYPLRRLAIGDLSAILAGQSPCGRTAMRIKGWMGRADQRTNVLGMFVDPLQVDRVLKSHNAASHWRGRRP
jgi:phenylacetate-CoA ligase